MRFCEAPEGCKYPVFSTDKLTRKGYCQSHALRYRTDLDRRSIIQKAMEKHKQVGSKIRSLQNTTENQDVAVKNIVKSELKEWFNYHMANSPKICENCGKSLEHYKPIDWFGSHDHIIEKSGVNGCPSVAAELDNHCVLGKWCCHSQKHTSNFNLSKMSVFPLLKERFAKFGHLIAENERKKIPDCFLN